MVITCSIYVHCEGMRGGGGGGGARCRAHLALSNHILEHDTPFTVEKLHLGHLGAVGAPALLRLVPTSGAVFVAGPAAPRATRTTHL